MTKFFISCALPYANGPCHLGHLRSTYIPADIFARFNRMIGNDVLLVCATDEHGTPIAVKADNEGKKPIEIATRYHRKIVKDLEMCDISLDNFSRTTSKTHYRIAQNFFLNLYNKDLIYEKEIKQLYCDSCNKFLPDRYVEGVCRFCNSPGARGDQCEVCGRHLDAEDLLDPKCLTCGKTPIIKKSNHYFFRLSKFQREVENFVYNTPKLPNNVKNYLKNWLKDDLKDWILSRDMDWGIPVPLNGAQGKIIYVWVEALIGYISSATEWSNKTGISWREYWDDTVLHFIGKDIIYHHGIFWPAMLKGYGCKNPDNIIAGEYLSLEGRKMSTSQGWVIWVKDFVEEFDSDLLRYYLTITAPLNKDMDFSWDDFARRVNDELADVLGNFLHRTFTFTNKFFDSKVPELFNLSDEDKKFKSLIEGLSDEVASSISNFKFRDGLINIFKMAKEGNKYFDYQKPWQSVKDDYEKASNCLHLSNQLSKILAITLKPYLPNKSTDILNILNVEDTNDWNNCKIFLDSGHEIKKAKPLFKKIDEEDINKEKEKLYELENGADVNTISENKTEKSNKKKETNSKMEKVNNKDINKKLDEKENNMMDIISIDDFIKLDLRIGIVLEAEKIEGSDKLLKLKVDIKEKELQVVAGLGLKYSPEQLINKKVTVLVNLKPAKLFGVKSEGMILATADSSEIITLNEAEIGEKIM
ncbi:MAG: methionine--tRNA ligase [Methanobrevibacter sp.]|jgi:methionyl-tRNA synthetase|nr:methionine--tRNA ligase [Candidatus Methanovirga meridionalis]